MSQILNLRVVPLVSLGSLVSFVLFVRLVRVVLCGANTLSRHGHRFTKITQSTQLSYPTMARYTIHTAITFPAILLTTITLFTGAQKRTRTSTVLPAST